jgi:hypothetical protein
LATPPSGSLSVALSQNDASVQGTVDIVPFVIPIPLTGSVSGNALSASGEARFSVDVGAGLPPVGTTARILNWSTTRSGNSMTGGFTLRIELDDPALGTVTVQVALQNVVLST